MGWKRPTTDATSENDRVLDGNLEKKERGKQKGESKKGKGRKHALLSREYNDFFVNVLLNMLLNMFLTANCNTLQLCFCPYN